MEEVCSLQCPFLPRPLFGRLLGVLAVWSVGMVGAFAAGGAGRIAIQTAPAGATVYLDGQPNGKSPAAIEGLAPGRYFVRVELDGYRPAEIVVELGSGQRYQSPALELIPEGEPLPRPVAAAQAPAIPTPAPPPRATPAPPAAPIAKTPEAGLPPPPAASVTPVPAPSTTQSGPATTTPPAPAADPAAAPTSDDDAAVQVVVNDYLNAIADSDVEAYVKLCAPSVEFYEDGTKTPTAIRKIRQQFHERWPVYKIDNVRDGRIRPGDKPGVKRASVTYDWTVSNPKTGKKASGTATDQLDFRESKGKWLLVRTRQVVDRSRR